MPKSPESFDFSKEKDQARFNKLSKSERTKIIEGAHNEAETLRQMVERGAESSYEGALGTLESLKRRGNLDNELLERNLNKIESVQRGIDEKVERISDLKNTDKNLQEQRSDLEEPTRKIKREAESRYPEIGGLAEEIYSSEHRVWEIQYRTRWDNKTEEEKNALNDEFKTLSSRIKSGEMQTSLRNMLANEVQDPEERLVLAREFNAIPKDDSFAYGPEDIEKKKNKILGYVGQLGLESFVRDDFKVTKDSDYSGDSNEPFEWERIRPLRNKLVQQWNLLPGDAPQKIQELRGRIDSGRTDIERAEAEKSGLEEEKRFLKIFLKNGLDLDSMQEKMPWAVRMLREDDGYGISVREDKQVMALLKSRSWNSGSAGMEYGTNIVVVRDNETNKAQKYIKWRDAYSASNDRPKLYFNRVKIEKISDQNVDVTVFTDSHNYSWDEKFALQKTEVKEQLLSPEDETSWKENYARIRSETTERCGVKGTMPLYVDLKFFEGTLPIGTNTGQEVPYKTPEVLDEKIDAKRGIGVFVVKSQIDHDAGFGKQFRWEAFLVNRAGEVRRVAEDHAYEWALKGGQKIDIDIRAEDLLLLYQKENKTE